MDEVEPAMLYWDKLNNSSGDYALDTKEGKEYFFIQQCILLALFYGDAQRAITLLACLEQNPDFVNIVADVLCDFPLGNMERLYEDTPEQVVFHQLLVKLLGIFSASEYSEIHEYIYRLFRKYASRIAEFCIESHESFLLTRKLSLSLNPSLAV